MNIYGTFEPISVIIFIMCTILLMCSVRVHLTFDKNDETKHISFICIKYTINRFKLPYIPKSKLVISNSLVFDRDCKIVYKIV